MLKVVNEISNDIVKDLNFELVDIEYIKEFGNYFLKIYVDKKGGITLDDCQKMNERLSLELDEKDPIPGEYYLEVSSPGLDRPLKTNKDLERNLGKDVELKLYKSFNNRKNYEGELKDYSEDKIILEERGELIAIPKKDISIIKLSIKF